MSTLPIHDRVEIWQGGALLYQLDDIAINIHIKDALTEGVGTFSFTLPTYSGVGTSYKYTDINLFDEARVWLSYGAVAGTALTIGKIYQIKAGLAKGYVREFTCKSQGEVLTRRIKRAKNYGPTDASDIIIDLANDLSIFGAGDITADANHESQNFEYEPYFDAVRRVSDYWVSSVAQVKKDFFVDVDNHLHWKARPIRPPGTVETLTIGTNLMDYSVLRDVSGVKNDIRVYGKFDENKEDPAYVPVNTCPNDENWSESVLNWTKERGTLLSMDAVNFTTGTGSVSCSAILDAGNYHSEFNRTFMPEFITATGKKSTTINSFARVSFDMYFEYAGAIGDFIGYIYLYAPDAANSFNRSIAMAATNTWENKSYLLNDGVGWAGVGAPNWERLEAVKFWVNTSGATHTTHVDALYLRGGRFYSSAANPASATSYGQRDMIHVDDALLSDADCLSRAQTLLYQLKDPVTRLDVTMPLNLNVKIGDRLTVTLAPEGITATDFDVLTVEHNFVKDTGGTTSFTAVSSAVIGNARKVPPVTMQEVVTKQATTQKALGKRVGGWH